VSYSGFLRRRIDCGRGAAVGRTAQCAKYVTRPFETAGAFHDGSTGLNRHSCNPCQPARHPCCRSVRVIAVVVVSRLWFFFQAPNSMYIVQRAQAIIPPHQQVLHEALFNKFDLP
jgi:hypothetical protein